jgi:hypothetical protein
MAARIVIATDRSLAEAIREKLLPEILSLFPSGYFQDKLYDTGEPGKGFRPGYVSFGLRPDAWNERQLIGGVLIRGTYPSSAIRSNSPEPNTPEWKEWAKNGNPRLKGGEAESIKLEAGYYNKTKGGTFDRARSLGDALFTISKTEMIEELVLANPPSVKSALESLVQDIIDDPPEGAESAGLTRSKSPYSTMKKFLNYLVDEDRRTFRRNEIDAVSQSTGKKPEDIMTFLRARGFSLDKAA